MKKRMCVEIETNAADSFVDFCHDFKEKNYPEEYQKEVGKMLLKNPEICNIFRKLKAVEHYKEGTYGGWWTFIFRNVPLASWRGNENDGYMLTIYELECDKMMPFFSKSKMFDYVAEMFRQKGYLEAREDW